VYPALSAPNAATGAEFDEVEPGLHDESSLWVSHFERLGELLGFAVRESAPRLAEAAETSAA
ncbi:MAG TPA: hypothetical protein VE998_07550, partial [Terriglobales bacterium]|nr:hypothetical protein [Terriglobales bacterium]